MGAYADLHVHTTASDGTLALDSVPRAAGRAGLAVVAVTDHDRLHPDLDRPVVQRGGVTLVAGVELRVESRAGRVDLLGYGAERTEALAALLADVQADRVRRGHDLVACVEQRLGVDLDVTVRPGFGRPHVARAVAAHPDLSHTVQAAFEDLLGDGRPCHVRRPVPAFAEALPVLGDACALVGLAHPFRYPDPEGALALCAELDAVERYYPYDGAPDPAPVERAVAEHDLLVTGGSDAHGETVGRAGLDRGAYAPVAACLGP
jgi:predicted metal-dependent phosphoesterase TrpH